MKTWEVLGIPYFEFTKLSLKDRLKLVKKAGTDKQLIDAFNEPWPSGCNTGVDLYNKELAKRIEIVNKYPNTRYLIDEWR